MIFQDHRARKKGGREEWADRTGWRRYRQKDGGRLQLRVKVRMGTGPKICKASALYPIPIVCVCVCACVILTHLWLT